MSVQNPIIPTATQAKGIDAVILDLQTHLDFDLAWLTNGMGRAYRLSKVRTNQSIVFLPEVYLGTDKFTYFAATPDNDKKGQSIFIVGNEGYPNQQLGFYGLLEYDVSIIFSVNLKLIDSTLLETEYFDEHQIEDVRESLIRNLLGKDYKVEVNEVVRQFEDVYSEFDVTQDRGIAHAPMSHFRFNCTVTLREDCAGVSLNRCGAILQNLSEDDKNNCILPTYDFSSVAVQDATTAQQQTDIIDWICSGTAFENNYSMRFGGINNYIYQASNVGNNLDVTSPSTWCFRVNFSNVAITQSIINKNGDGLNGIGYNILLVAGKIRIVYRSGSTSNDLILESNFSFSAGVSYHVCITYNGNSLVSGFNIYIGTAATTITPIRDNLTGNIKSAIDLEFGTGSGFLSASLNVVRAWNLEFNATQVALDYNGDIPTFPIETANLVVGNDMGDRASFTQFGVWVLPETAALPNCALSANSDITNRVPAI